MEEKSKYNKIRFKIGEIEFEAESSDADVLARERNEFVSTILPQAVEAILSTKKIMSTRALVAPERNEALPIDTYIPTEAIEGNSLDLLQKSLTEFVMQKGATAHNDFILCAAYYDEKKNRNSSFSSENIKKYYEEARKKPSSNPSQYLNVLAAKGYIVDSPEHKGALPKVYKLSNSGLLHVETLRPKDIKTKKVVSKPRKPRPKTESIYSVVNIDELNLQNYPDIKKLKNIKEKIMIILYIISNENKGEWFTINDVVFIMKSKLGEMVTSRQDKGVFENNPKWFDTMKKDGSKEFQRKLLNGGREYVELLISK